MGNWILAEAQWSVLARFQHLAFANQMSSRAAQLALENASASNAALLASSFQGHVRRAAQSKHANYVVENGRGDVNGSHRVYCAGIDGICT